jgi:hypothetical protein
VGGGSSLLHTITLVSCAMQCKVCSATVIWMGRRRLIMKSKHLVHTVISSQPWSTRCAAAGFKDSVAWVLCSSSGRAGTAAGMRQCGAHSPQAVLRVSHDDAQLACNASALGHHWQPSMLPGLRVTGAAYVPCYWALSFASAGQVADGCHAACCTHAWSE